eukprot:TRINITY_DN342_c0_g1_i2.p1 TRINITY_DN342_c0_g1~~TRINITY_DN342_c0_g1_i2.p1  ORF type:complete len:115 (+),score=43.30 TRINITY_DN342_c0_g1_i2:129-473(+)
MAKGLKKEQAQREFTVKLARSVRGSAFKKRAPRAIRALKKFASKEMRTKDVRIHIDLNKFVWGRGIAKVPRRVRVRLTRKLNENEDAKESYYTLVSYVPCTDFKGLKTQIVADE